MIAPSERDMWARPIKEMPEKLTDAELNERYSAGEHRIVTETNREKIPNFVEALERPGYMQVRPFYQRRERWDRKRQSRLIESFIMNIPVPPLFLYEKDYNQYEVMDGQQRITALRAFYSGEFRLAGLEIWRQLNGRTYSTLPSKVRSGLDRRSISYTVVLRESTPDEEEAVLLRQTVFERLNTGGVRLEYQEIRNCIFQGPFNDLLVSMSQMDEFRDSWQLPRYTPGEEEGAASPIKTITLFEKMGDVENVLRFFALRHVEHYTRGMQGFLDLYMARARSFTQEDMAFLESLFSKTIRVARDIYGDLVFRPYNVETKEWDPKPQKAFYDAVMVGLSQHLDRAEELVHRREEVIGATAALFGDNPEGTFTGRGNTKADVRERINKYAEMLKSVL